MLHATRKNAALVVHEWKNEYMTVPHYNPTRARATRRGKPYIEYIDPEP